LIQLNINECLKWLKVFLIKVEKNLKNIKIKLKMLEIFGINIEMVYLEFYLWQIDEKMI